MQSARHGAKYYYGRALAPDLDSADSGLALSHVSCRPYQRTGPLFPTCSKEMVPVQTSNVAFFLKNKFLVTLISKRKIEVSVNASILLSLSF